MQDWGRSRLQPEHCIKEAPCRFSKREKNSTGRQGGGKDFSKRRPMSRSQVNHDLGIKSDRISFFIALTTPSSRLSTPFQNLPGHCGRPPQDFVIACRPPQPTLRDRDYSICYAPAGESRMGNLIVFTNLTLDGVM